MRACLASYLASLAACLLASVAAAPAAHAACSVTPVTPFFVAANRSGDPPCDSPISVGGDRCCDKSGLQAVDIDADGYGNYCDGDLDQDCAVGITDFTIFWASFGCWDSQGCYNPVADANLKPSPTRVGMIDFFFFWKQFKRHVPGD